MRFDFFTLGGSQFWEDVFFYQKWRIQRNCRSKTYRLLDNWDIKRHEGGFEDCRRAFVKYIEIYQLSRQRGHMIIMLHGLGDSKNIFKPLWRKALEEGYMAAAINYPSTRKDIESHVRQLEFLLEHLEDVTEVSFVTKGIGGIILQKLMSLDSNWQKRLKINRIVEVSPPNQGCSFLTKLGKYNFIRWLFGSVISEISKKDVTRIPPFPHHIDVGVISKQCPFMWLAHLLPQKLKSFFPTSNEAKMNHAKEIIHIKTGIWNPFKNKKIVNACINFIKKGTFE